MDRIHVAAPIVQMFFVGAAAILFNFFPEKVGVLVSLTDPTSFISLLAPEFQVHMPWLNLWWALTLSMCVAHLMLGRWYPATRWADLGLTLWGIAILARMALGGPVCRFPTVDADIRGALGLAAVVATIVAVKKLNRLLA